MKKAMYYRRLNHLIKIIDIKLNCLPENPLGSDYVLFYPDEHKTRLSDSEFKTLMESIEKHFKNSDGEVFTALLCAYMTRKKMKAHELYNAALIEKSYFYQLLSGKHTPSRDTVIRVALALKLALDESKGLLQTLGYSFFEKSRRDIIVMECINHKAGLYTTELLLNKYREVSLCNKAMLLIE